MNELMGFWERIRPFFFFAQGPGGFREGFQACVYRDEIERWCGFCYNLVLWGEMGSQSVID